MLDHERAALGVRVALTVSMGDQGSPETKLRPMSVNPSTGQGSAAEACKVRNGLGTEPSTGAANSMDRDGPSTAISLRDSDHDHIQPHGFSASYMMSHTLLSACTHICRCCVRASSFSVQSTAQDRATGWPHRGEGPGEQEEGVGTCNAAEGGRLCGECARARAGVHTFPAGHVARISCACHTARPGLRNEDLFDRGQKNLAV